MTNLHVKEQVMTKTLYLPKLFDYRYKHYCFCSRKTKVLVNLGEDSLKRGHDCNWRGEGTVV